MLSKRRRSIRYKNATYLEEGAYFITLCTEGRRRILGDVFDGKMVPSTLGWIVDDEWRRVAEMRQGLELDEYTLMPDHFHALLVYKKTFEAPIKEGSFGGMQRLPFSLGSVVAGFKAAVTSRARIVTEESAESIWQRNYYERIVRNAAEMDSVRDYIRQNPAKWNPDEPSPDEFHA